MLTEERFRRIRDWAGETAITPSRLASNRAIVHRIAKYIKEAATDEELYAMLLRDYRAWAAAFLNNEHKKPVLLAPWQTRNAKARGLFPFVWTFACRKAGKTRALSANIAWDMCSRDHLRGVAFAPTEDQAFAFDMVRDYFLG